MGVLKHEHLSPAGMTIATMLRKQLEDEAAMLGMTANRVNLLHAEDREDIDMLVQYLEDAAHRMRLLVEDL